MHETTVPGTRPRARRRSVRTGLVLVVGAALALSACSNSKNGGKASASKATAGDQAAFGAIAKATTPTGQPLTTARQIVYTAELRVRVARVGPASTRAGSIVDAAGGYLFSQNSNLTGHTEATLVFKVPPTQFERVLDRFAALGTPLAKNVNASDVTDQVVDLEGRLDSATTSAARLRSLLADAKNVPDVVAIEHELAARESEVESLQGQLRLVKNQVQLATVTLALTTKAPQHKTSVPGFTRSLSAGWTAFGNVAKVTLAAVGAALPFGVFAGLAAAIVLVVRRRRRSARVIAP